MSHTTTVKGLAIKSDDSIRAAVLALQAQGIDVELKENAVPRMFYRHQEEAVGKCEFVINVKKAQYDVGLKKNKAGDYEIIFDEWGGGIRNQIGITKTDSSWDDDEKRLAHIAKFTLEYNKHLVTSQFNAQNIFDIEQVTGDNGEIQMVANLSIWG